MHTNAIESSPSVLIPVIWIESVRWTCRLTVTAFLLFGLVTALSGCAVSTTKRLGIVPSSDADPDSMTGKSRGSFLRQFGLPNAQFVNDSDGTTFFVYERYTLQETEVYWPFIIMALAGGVCSSNCSVDYEDRDDYCVLLRFGPDDRLLDYAVKDHHEGYNCTNEFASQLAGTRTLSVDALNDVHDEVTAAIELAELTGNLAPLEQWVTKGNQPAAFAYYKHLSSKREMFTEAWGILCKIANESYGKAQSEVGYWHKSSAWSAWKGTANNRLPWLKEIEIEPNNRIAFMWYELAVLNGDSTAVAGRGYVAADMTAEEIAQAEQMVRDWKPGDCPSAEHRLTGD